MKAGWRLHIIFLLGALPSIELMAASETACRAYANRAVQQYQIANTHANCHHNMNARWQPNYQNHYGWCLNAQTSWLQSEQKIRDNFLAKCGGLSPIDNGPQLHPVNE